MRPLQALTTVPGFPKSPHHILPIYSYSLNLFDSLIIPDHTAPHKPLLLQRRWPSSYMNDTPASKEGPHASIREDEHLQRPTEKQFLIHRGKSLTPPLRDRAIVYDAYEFSLEVRSKKEIENSASRSPESINSELIKYLQLRGGRFHCDSDTTKELRHYSHV